MISTDCASPNVQMNGSAICRIVSCSFANTSTLSESRKLTINARQNASMICGFFFHLLKFANAVSSICLSLYTFDAPPYRIVIDQNSRADRLLSRITMPCSSKSQVC